MVKALKVNFHPFNDGNQFQTVQEALVALFSGSGSLTGGTSDAASGATTDLGATTTLRVRITGTTTITSFGTTANTLKFVTFAGALTLTHNATSLILPNNGSNIVTEAGDALIASSDASGNWTVLDYQRADGTALSQTFQSDVDANGFNLLFDDNTGIRDDSGNETLIFQKTASAVNQIDVHNAATGNSPQFVAAGDDTNIKIVIGGKGTGGCEVEGTSTNDNATLGFVGQLIDSEIQSGSAVALTTGVTANVTSIDLTAGDWDVWGNVWWLGAAGTNVTLEDGAMSMTSATLTTAPGQGGRNRMLYIGGVVMGTSQHGFFVGHRRISVASTTTVYLVAQATFTVSTYSAFGYIGARRRR